MFCRNCGKELAGTPEICATCGAKPVNATAFCRFCGNATTAQDVMCPKCGAAIRIITKSGEVSSKEGRGRFTTTKTILKILAVVTFVSWYALMSVPPRMIIRPLKAAASDAVMVTTGYTAHPLNAISASPKIIPYENASAVFNVNDTQQLTIYAIYKNTTTSNTTTAGRAEDVTANCTYQSSNNKIATVTADGLVQAVARGSANINVSYTAAPGSANISSAAQGKVPITVTVTVPVTVRGGMLQ